MSNETMPPLPEATYYGYCDVPRLTDEEIYDYARAYAEQRVAEERRLIKELCEQISVGHWMAFKRGFGPERGDPHYQGLSDGAEECAQAVDARIQDDD